MKVTIESADGEETVIYGVTDYEYLGGAEYSLYPPSDYDGKRPQTFAGRITQVIDSSHVPHDEVPHPSDADEVHDWRTESYYARLGPGVYA